MAACLPAWAIGALLALLPPPPAVATLGPPARPASLPPAAQDWAAAASAAGLPGLPGERLLVQYQCGSCHQIPGVQAADGRLGPPLAGLGRRPHLAGSLPNDAATLARWIADAPALRPGTAMPATGATPAEAAAMAAWLLAR